MLIERSAASSPLQNPRVSYTRDLATRASTRKSTDVRTDLESLLAENEKLRERVRELEAQIDLLSQYPTLSAGIRGEKLAARITGGVTTSHTAPFDIDASGELIEVKYAKLTQPVAGRPTMRWLWNKIYGEKGGKSYTSLLLIGEADQRFRHRYLDPDAPYVLFLIPFSEALALCTKGNPLMITLSSNPDASRGASADLWHRWQTTIRAVEQRYAVKPLS